MIPRSSATLDRRVSRAVRSASASRIRSAIRCFAISPLSISASSSVAMSAVTLGAGPCRVGDAPHRPLVTSVTLRSRDLGPKMPGVSGWGLFVATVAALLLATAFLGNLYASRRRAPRLSVYELIRRRLESERRGGPS